MKNAFLEKLENNTSEMIRTRIEKRKFRENFENDLAQESYAKQLFIKQIGEMKKKYI